MQTTLGKSGHYIMAAEDSAYITTNGTLSRLTEAMLSEWFLGVIAGRFGFQNEFRLLFLIFILSRTFIFYLRGLVLFF